jgi:hypothetical protein
MINIDQIHWIFDGYEKKFFMFETREVFCIKIAWRNMIVYFHHWTSLNNVQRPFHRYCLDHSNSWLEDDKKGSTMVEKLNDYLVVLVPFLFVEETLLLLLFDVTISLSLNYYLCHPFFHSSWISIFFGINYSTM